MVCELISTVCLSYAVLFNLNVIYSISFNIYKLPNTYIYIYIYIYINSYDLFLTFCIIIIIICIILSLMYMLLLLFLFFLFIVGNYICVRIESVYHFVIVHNISSSSSSSSSYIYVCVYI